MHKFTLRLVVITKALLNQIQPARQFSAVSWNHQRPFRQATMLKYSFLVPSLIRGRLEKRVGLSFRLDAGPTYLEASVHKQFCCRGSNGVVSRGLDCFCVSVVMLRIENAAIYMTC